ncbi:hypothetical protein [Umezawaea beigongshangensis]|uniref:hypothetical protein n=1 Tax=Umezawaea beigongshangensis TaxID=2780383 RepID=UPI0018F17512|nr:hypothetical protein [Umezawaea beigongshangensis]
MLHIVLLLVLAALGLLVPALTTADPTWAWSSVGASAAAAAVLALDWWFRRRSSTGDRGRAAGAGGPPRRPDEDQVSGDDHEAVAEGAVAHSVVSRVTPSAEEPAEEDTDAADLLTVTDLTDEVRVLDERPRYHLGTCTWLDARPTLGLPVSEARQLGFTPCAGCRPDETLAARHRAART